MLTKAAPVLVKAVGPDDALGDGVFEAIVSVFGNVDSYGDRVVEGAFADDLKAWAASGSPIPCYWSHRMDDPDYNLGYVLEAKELSPGDPLLPAELAELGGLWVRVQLDLDSPKAAQVYRLLKGRRVTQFSFAYDVLESAWVKDESGGDSVYELRKLHIYEVGPTPIGANQETELLTVKTLAEHAARAAADVKAGRAISAKNEATLRAAKDAIAEAVSQIDAVLSVLDSADETDDSKATAPAEPVDPKPDGAKGEPMPHATADLDAARLLELSLI